MKEFSVELGGRKVTVNYRPVFHNLVEVRFVVPYKGLVIEAGDPDNEDLDFLDKNQAEKYVEEAVELVLKQIHNVQTHREVYEMLSNDYRRITDIMISVLKSSECIPAREKFRYHYELQTRVKEEMYNQLREQLPVIDETNRAEFLIHPYRLTEILAVT